MLIFTAKLNRKKLLAIAILAAFALGALILAGVISLRVLGL